MLAQLNLFESEISGDKTTEPVNVASVPQRSPFRYPGGKTWLIPLVRKWLKQEGKTNCLIEPFAGGGIVSLTAAFEDLAQTIKMAELDEEVAAVWEVILNGKNQWLADKIKSFDLTVENVRNEFEKTSKQIQDVAFCTILKNRIYHGGIITKGSGMIKNGENGKGIKSRWYPKTLSDRITAINYIKSKIEFKTGDAFQLIEENKDNPENYFFIDPPYTIAGKRLYSYFEIDHEKLFFLVSQIKGKFMLTYDDTVEVRGWATKFDLKFRTIPMKTTHHIKKNELIICDNFNWWDEQQNL